ncbi:MAG: hypothetical protein J5669_06650 [Bacteroidales bacterium]|nr:hypothetical protein [Bacteroidales bacterium]
MKKIVLTAVLFLLTVCMFQASAQGLSGWDIEAGVSYPFFDRMYSRNLKGQATKNAEIQVPIKSTSAKPGPYVYSPVIIPTFSLTAGRRLDKIPLSIRLGVYVNHASNMLTGGPSPLLEQETIVHLLPEVRVYYLERQLLRLYGSAGAGLRMRVYTETLDGDKVGKAHFDLSWQLTPIGLELGKQLYFNLYLGFGHTTAPVGLGIGYKFRQ